MEFHTFVICAYGESPYLEACIRSLLSQTEKSRILCATSTPGPWLRRLLDRYQIPLHVREGEPGIAADWNFAAGLADSRFVTLAHQDDRYSRHYVEELKKAYRRWPDMTVFTTDCAVVKNGRLQRPGAMELVKKLLRMPLRLAGLADRTWVKMGALRFGNPLSAHPAPTGRTVCRRRRLTAGSGLCWTGTAWRGWPCSQGGLSARSGRFFAIGSTPGRPPAPASGTTAGKKRSGRCLPGSGRPGPRIC